MKSISWLVGLLVVTLIVPSLQEAETFPGPSGEEFLTLGRLSEAEISSDGKNLITFGTTGLLLWDVETGNILKQIPIPIDLLPIRTFKFIPNTNRIIVDALELFIWDLETNEVVGRFPKEAEYRNTPVISPDGRYCVLFSSFESENAFMDLWNVEKQSLEHHFVQSILAVDFSPDGKHLLINESNGKLILWNLEDSDIVWEQTLGNYADTVKFTPDGEHFITRSYGMPPLKWNTLSGRTVLTYPVIGDFSISPDGQTLIVIDEYFDPYIPGKTVYNVNAETGEVVDTFIGPRLVSVVQFLPDQVHILTYDDQGEVSIWNRITGNLTKSFGPYINNLYSVYLSPDGSLLGIGSVSNIHIVEKESGRLLKLIPLDYSDTVALSFSKDNRYLASVSSGRSIRIWSVETGEMVQRMDGLIGMDYSIQLFDNGSKLVTGLRNDYPEWGTVWDVQKGEKLLSLLYNNVQSLSQPTAQTIMQSGIPDRRFIVAVSPDERYMISGERDLALWNLETGKRIRTFLGKGSIIKVAKFSADGNSIFAGDDEGKILQWNRENAQTIRVFEGPKNPIRSLSVSYDQKYLISSSISRRNESFVEIMLWDVDSGNLLHSFDGNHNFLMLNTEFLPSSHSFITSSQDGTIRQWHVNQLIQSGVHEYSLHE